jgi:lysyl oxidase/Big-like domain-containing protein
MGASPSQLLCRPDAWDYRSRVALARRIQRRAVVAGAVALAAAWSLGVTQAAAASDVLPHLVADPPTGAELDVDTGRLLLRFEGYVHNVGPGPLEIRGQRASTADQMIANQRIYQTDGSFRDVAMPGAQMVYADADGHHHWHLQDVAAYSLWNQARSQRVAPSMKVGFCLADHEHIDSGVGPASPVYSDDNGRAFCQKLNPGALSVFEGVSAGWRDLYEKALAFQWVDVTDVQPGVYWLREDVDPNRIVRDAGPAGGPAYAAVASTIPGYDAKPLALGSVAPRSATTIIVDASHYGPTGAPRFRVTRSPAHGTLSVKAGSLFAHRTITYRPKRGYRGPDRFTYIARDSASSYPHNPAGATVSLWVGPPVVSSARISPSTFRLGSLMPRLSRGPQVGTTIGFRLSAAARARLAFSQPKSGRQVGSLTIKGHAGTNTLRFQGQLSRRRSLKPGRYTLTITAFDRAGNKSRPRSLSFTVLGQGRAAAASVSGHRVERDPGRSVNEGPVGEATVAMAGAPGSLPAGAGVQLAASVTGDAPHVTWSVNGIVGGNAKIGRIDRTGFYTAPWRVPTRAEVTIGARSGSGALDQLTIRITQTPKRHAAPLPTLPAREAKLSRPTAIRIGGMLVVTVIPGRAGTVKLRASAAGHRLGMCQAKGPAGRLFTCRFRLRRPLHPRQLQIVAALTRARLVLATRTRRGLPTDPPTHRHPHVRLAMARTSLLCHTTWTPV